MHMIKSIADNSSREFAAHAALKRSQGTMVIDVCPFHFKMILISKNILSNGFGLYGLHDFTWSTHF